MAFLNGTLAKFLGSGSLRRRAANAGAWSVAELGTSHALRLASNLIMTRLLAPEAFGLMAMVATLITAMNLFTDIGIGQSVIRSRRGDEPHFLRVAWSVQIMRSTAIASLVVLAGVLLWLIGPALARDDTVYADPELPFLIMASALSVIFGGFVSSNDALAARRLEYGRPALVHLASQVVALAAMFGFAMIQASVWALLGGMIVGSATRMVLSHLVLKGPAMALAWDREVADELWHFGKWIIGSSVFTFVARQADRLILGALLDQRTFGTYVIAVLWIEAVRMVIQKMNGQIGFTAFSEVLNQRPKQIGSVYGKYSRALDFACVACFVAALFSGPALIAILYTESYLAAAGYMPFLALSILQMRFHSLGALVLASGDSRTAMLNTGIMAILICIFLPLGYRYFGMEGALLAVTLAPLCATAILIRRVAKILKTPPWRDVAWIGAVLACGALLVLFFEV